MNEGNQPLVPENPTTDTGPIVPEAQPIAESGSAISIPTAQDNGSLVQGVPDVATTDTLKEKPKMKTGKKVAIIICIVLLVGAIATAIILVLLNIEKGRQDAMREDAKAFANLVRNDKTNKSIYTFEEYGNKANLNKSPYDNDYTNESYVTNYNDHTYICLYDGDHRIMGFIDRELIIDQDGECKYEFVNHADISGDPYDYDEKKTYLKNYTKLSYDFLNPTFEEKDGKLTVDNNYFSYQIDVKFENNKAVVDSNFGEKEKEFYKTGTLRNIVEYYAKVYFKADSLKSKPVYEVRKLTSANYEYIRMLSTYEYEEAKKFIDEFMKVIEEKGLDMTGRVVDIIAINSNYKRAYDIAIYINKDTGKLDTIIEKEDE